MKKGIFIAGIILFVSSITFAMPMDRPQAGSGYYGKGFTEHRPLPPRMERKNNHRIAVKDLEHAKKVIESKGFQILGVEEFQGRMGKAYAIKVKTPNGEDASFIYTQRSFLKGPITRNMIMRKKMHKWNEQPHPMPPAVEPNAE